MCEVLDLTLRIRKSVHVEYRSNFFPINFSNTQLLESMDRESSVTEIQHKWMGESKLCV